MRISDWSSDVCSSDLGGHPELGDAAATFGQGDGSALLKLHGPAAMLMLQKGFFVDLRSALGAKDSCVCSVVAHVNVIAWNAGSDTYGVAVPRSFAGSFWHWFSCAAAAEGDRKSTRLNSSH